MCSLLTPQVYFLFVFVFLFHLFNNNNNNNNNNNRPCWLICGREDDELQFGLRLRRTLMAQRGGGVECWFSGGGVSAAAMDIRHSDDPLYEEPSTNPAVDDDVISRRAFKNVPKALLKMSRAKMNKLFAGYEGDPGELGPDMMKRCSSVLFLVSGLDGSTFSNQYICNNWFVQKSNRSAT